ncbi:branched-chain amino acid transport [Rhizobium albus]|jgi:uncharacterized membrane protein|nr:branched-chain amino acid transport [Rhizobium albus]
MDGFSVNVWIILAAALATYATRIGGHLILSRFERLHPRVEAALNAVPAAVLTTLFAPAAVFNGTAEALTMAAAILIGLRLPMLATVFIGTAIVVALRALM